jgi:hypothetical protein
MKTSMIILWISLSIILILACTNHISIAVVLCTLLLVWSVYSPCIAPPASRDETCPFASSPATQTRNIFEPNKEHFEDSIYATAPLEKLINHRSLQFRKYQRRSPQKIDDRKSFDEFMASDYTNKRNINRVYL